MNLKLDSTVTLNNGVEMPQLGMGVWKVNNTGASQSVQWALKHGYKAIDTAKQYGNETGVGEGLQKGFADNGLKREDIFLTTKIFNGDQGYQSTLDNFEGQLKRLQTDYVDLLLIHWPVDGTYLDTWRALETIYKEGKARAIGVSNFNIERLKDILKNCSIKPAVNQMEYHPLCQEVDIKNFCDENNILLEAWSPLGGGSVLGDTRLKKIADKYNKSVAQVILRWDLQNGIITIPKSVHEERIVQNSDVYDFELSDADMKEINGFDNDKRSLWYGDFFWSGNPDGYVDSVEEWDD
ncbi:oxidoreductase [Companilactobacillus paralimentarius DSM 13238 = JCM 10415]|jgi:Aldo/keto reductases, related to diketogulonate reductase|uniref:Oxidoreductase n=2 Tax=Companilactobacillus paralimentarius TaxID=83526 RepID=A0A0R1PGB7_9LACO|nr:aldo/keto reductase [Companilactobacillus paralimentarius]KAE9564381.1 MFS transporter [Companilactobacillus paralimentarius]KRL31278.1 oxidoreductase [Companilactobacillus paralimentarius DSM 13238 = JCM 10415]MDR4932974.1 aldo/keto reductase [Companilactobacillus paralimentarius]QFR69508.1 aldo/keto reductase [Companilactobacillus paralimentarius]